MYPVEFPVDALQLIPQRGKMKLIDRLLRVSEDEACASADMSGKTMFITPSGRILPAALVELAAQATACFAGYISILEDNQGPMSGLLVGLQDIVIEELPPAEDEISVELHQESAIGPFSLSRVSMFSNQAQFAGGLLKTWEQAPQSAELQIDRQDVDIAGFYPVLHDLAPIEHEILASVISIKNEDDHIRARLCYRPDFSGFNGHFDNFPVLPGIMLLQSVETVVSHQQNHLYRIRKIENAKFAKLVFPGDEIDYDIALSYSEGEITAVVLIYGGNELKVRFSLTLA